MYKDKARQREANRERQRRYKARQKALPEQGVTSKALPEPWTVADQCDYEDDDYPEKPKRGKDIQRFEDLPLDVQHTIDRISTSPEEKNKRTVAAIKYQHLYPYRYHSTGVECVYMKEQRQRVGAGHVQVSKPGDEDYVPTCETTDMIEHVAVEGGEYNFKTVKGEVKDVHYSPPDGDM